MSTSPGVTSRPRALIVRRASFFGNDAATTTILPPLTATSSWPFSPAAGSSTSPSITSRSYFIVSSPTRRTATATLPRCLCACHPARRDLLVHVSSFLPDLQNRRPGESRDPLLRGPKADKG